MPKKAPLEIQVNDDLEAARPLDREEFLKVKRDEVDVDELSEEEEEFYEHVRGIAKSITNDRQYYPVTCRKTDDGLELVTGYSRYLACLYAGRAVRYEARRMTDEEILDMIYTENEVRRDIDPLERARVIAKRMERYDEENDRLLPVDHEDVDESEAMTAPEFAEKVGKSRSTIYQHLSPLRQDMRMRDEFGDQIPESSMKLIERISNTKDQQYTLASALVKSDIETHSSFKGSYEIAKKKSEDTEELIHHLCRRMINLREEDPKREFVDPQKQKTESLRSIEEKEQELLEQEKNEQKTDYGQPVPEPSAKSGDDPSPDIEVNTPDDTDTVADENIDGTGAGESGVGVIPPKQDQPHQDTEIDIKLPAGEDICRLIREECDARDKDPDEFVTEIVKIHFRREGMLSDTPEAKTTADD